MKTRSLVGIAFFLFSISLACSSLEVASDYDHEFDFSGYHSFAWFDDSKAERKPQRPNPIIDARVHRAIAAELISKGFAQTAPDKADFFVTYFTSTDQKLSIYHSGYGYGWGPWGGWWGPAYYMPTTHVSQYDVGTLVLDVIDSRTKNLVWRGMAQKVLDDSDRSEEKIRAYINEVLASFPPGKS